MDVTTHYEAARNAGVWIAGDVTECVSGVLRL